MKSIEKVISKELIINKSKFINHLIPVSSLDEITLNLKKLRELYNDANHHCFAYVLGNNQEIQKFNDDGEPSKTAGLPMLEVIKKNDLTNVLNVTIRYFGGVKLGAGGLTRAYTKSCAECINDATFTELTNFSEVNIRITFDNIGNVEKYIRDNFILEKTIYTEFVNYYVTLKSSLLAELENNITEYTKGSAVINVEKTYDLFK